MILATMLVLAQAVQAQVLSESRMLYGPVYTCVGDVNPKLGAYSITLWGPSTGYKWYWTYTEPGGPFYNRTIYNACANGCRQPYVVKRLAPVSPVNYVPDGWAVRFTAEGCYHAFLDQYRYGTNPVNGLLYPQHVRVDFCQPKEGP